MLDSKIIKKVVNQIQNLRILGFNALTKEDLEELTGGLMQQDAKALSDRLTAAGAVLHGHTWVINGLDVDELAKAPTVRLPIGETVARVRVPAGEWLKDSFGHWSFQRDPNFVLPIIEDADPDNVQDEDSGEPSDCLEPSKGNLNLDI
jgi:hypothetical protein